MWGGDQSTGNIPRSLLCVAFNNCGAQVLFLFFIFFPFFLPSYCPSLRSCLRPRSAANMFWNIQKLYRWSNVKGGECSASSQLAVGKVKIDWRWGVARLGGRRRGRVGREIVNLHSQSKTSFYRRSRSFHYVTNWELIREANGSFNASNEFPVFPFHPTMLR